MKDKEITAMGERLDRLVADLTTLILATAPHVTSARVVRELVERYSPNGTETRPSALPEQRMEVA